MENMLVKLMHVWDSIGDAVQGGMLATVVCYLRAAYDGREPRIIRRLLEAVICGLIVYSVTTALPLVFPHLPQGVGKFVGGMIGFIGVDKFREMLMKRLNSVVTKEGDK